MITSKERTLELPESSQYLKHHFWTMGRNRKKGLTLCTLSFELRNKNDEKSHTKLLLLQTQALRQAQSCLDPVKK